MTICQICDAQGDGPIYSVREMMQGTRHVFHYFECTKCGCLQLIDPPTNSAPYYTNGYYSLLQDPTLLFKPAIKSWLKKRRDYFAITGDGIIGNWINGLMPSTNIELYNFRKIHLKTSDTILDVGSGAGLFTYIFYNAGFVNISGIDPYLANDIRYDNGLLIKHGTLENGKEGSWDVILFNHSFEHIAQPYNALNHVKRLLKKGGKCVIRIPTCSSFAWEHYRENWVQIDAPRHLFLFSMYGLELLAKRSGFDFQYIAHESTALQFIGSEQYKMDIPMRGDKRSWFEGNTDIFSPNQIDSFEKKAKQLNLERKGDSIAVCLHKN